MAEAGKDLTQERDVIVENLSAYPAVETFADSLINRLSESVKTLGPDACDLDPETLGEQLWK